MPLPAKAMSVRVADRLSSLLWLSLTTFTILYYSDIKCDQFSKSIQTVSSKFGVQLLNIGYERSCFETISENFRKHRSEVKQIDATKMMEEIRKDLINMLNWKKQAVERIASESERISAQHVFDKDINYLGYYNMKYIYDDRNENRSFDENFKELKLSSHPNFEGSHVNLDYSAVHVPINVYEKAVDIQNDIKWSEALTETFKGNLYSDPSLSWQFFGSSKGFIRIYPATNWKVPYDAKGQSKESPDLYDCRVRQWYIQGAASPKDVVVLLDMSGSMTGLRRNIALNVVYTILDTLTENDYVLVAKFTNDVTPVSTCHPGLTQATRQNIEEIKTNLDSIKTQDIANFTAAFIYGFVTLQDFKNSKNGAQCNQAIMLITDGAPETYEQVFKDYNADKSVRVFTYVIGREVTQIKEVYWMACNNRGYYAQVANLAEVREQVQQYIPVMSRPLVLTNSRIFSWTPVYAHSFELQLSNWIWIEREKKHQIDTLLEEKSKRRYKKPLLLHINNEEIYEEDINEYNKKIKDTNEIVRVFDENTIAIEEANQEDELNTIENKMKIWDELEFIKRTIRKKKVQLITTISTPVFDQRTHINVTKKILYKNVYKDSDPEAIRIANLLGVAGIDVPIREIEKIVSPFKLGVNGYSFVLTNNGKILYHPNFRPMYQDMLKPFFSSVDLFEVEITNNTERSRYVDEKLQEIRNEMLNGLRGSKKMAIKTYFDLMKRSYSRMQHYVYGKLDDTPFSFAIVLPEPYGSYRFMGQIDLKHKAKSENYTRYFGGTHWRIHPDWVYCENPHKLSGIGYNNTPEESLLQFVSNELAANNFQWKTNNLEPQQYQNFTCDEHLLQSLLFDAINTHIFHECGDFSRKFNPKDDRTIEIVNAFVATRSGLTRFTNPAFGYDKNKNENEYYTFTRSIDEIFYRRAVDFYFIDSKAFVYSVPFDAPSKDSLVTSSHAIFVGGGKMTAPVAVVGVQYNHSSFSKTFLKIAEQYDLKCKLDVQCWVLDNNAFVIVSDEDHEDSFTGRFFGEINHELLQDMVRVKVYRKIRHFDYQAICIDMLDITSSSMSFLNPFHYIKNALLWMFSKVTSFYMNTLGLYSWITLAEEFYEPTSDDSYINDLRFNKTLPRPCDKEFDLYELVSYTTNQTQNYVQICDESCSRHYYVQNIPHSNLIILALAKSCRCGVSSYKMEATEVEYNDSGCHFYQEESVRHRPDQCYNYNEGESEIKYCGGSDALQSLSIWSTLVVAIVVLQIVPIIMIH